MLTLLLGTPVLGLPRRRGRGLDRGAAQRG
jgi:hypothetical protein